MDSKRFDNWTKNRALRLSRRNALRLAGFAGASTALAAKPLDSLAQTTCTLTLHGETIGGPSASTVYDGKLTYTIGANGSLTNATYTPTSGAPAQVNGTIVGRAIDLLIAIAPGKVLPLSGTIDKQSPTCPAAAAGVLTGPQLGDLGAWQATGSAATTTQPSAPIPSNGGNCQAPSFACGPNCCPGGSTCTNTTQGICACPNGTTQCGNSCVTNCPNGQTLDLDSCTCTSSCTPDQGGCNASAQCCSGFCDPGSGACQTCQFLACEGIGCVDPSFDSNNCGGCGVVCSAPTATCTEGACTCQVDGLPCTSHSDCCSDSCAFGICGCVPVGGACTGAQDFCCGRNEGATICTSGNCRYLDGRAACFADNECITGICKNGNCASCLDPLEGPCTRDAECCNYNGLGCVNGVCPQ